MTLPLARAPTLEPIRPAQSRRPVLPRLTVGMLVGLGAASGFLLGAVVSLRQAAPYSHARGACIALEFAENFGAVGMTQKRQTLRAMTTSAGRHHGLFPLSVEAFEDLCARALTTEIRLGR